MTSARFCADLVVPLTASIGLSRGGVATVRHLERVLRRRDEVEITLVVALGASLLFGLAPAWHASGRPPVDALKAGGRSAGGRSRQALRSLLVVTETALALVGTTATLAVVVAVWLKRIDMSKAAGKVLQRKAAARSARSLS